MSDRTFKVLFFGDSICVGQYVSIHKGWVTRISQRLSELEPPDARFVVVNASANGRTTRQALEAMPYEVQSQHPEVMILQFGMNNCNYWASDPGVPRVSPKAFEANLEEIMERAFNCGTQTVLLNTNHPSGLTDRIMNGTTFSYQKSCEQYNELIRRVADRCDERVLLTDIERVFFQYTDGDPDRLTDLLMPAPDLLHLSEKGHDLYYEHLGPVIESTVQQLLQRVPA